MSFGDKFLKTFLVFYLAVIYHNGEAAENDNEISTRKSI